MPTVHFAAGGPTTIPEMKEYEKQNHFTSQSHVGDMLQISPDVLYFPREEGKETLVHLTSNYKAPITYKIQTTSPEKFRVKPRSGVLNENQSITVSILLKSEHRLAEGQKDKFLIMSMVVPPNFEMSGQNVAELWKQKPTNSPDVEQHRLCCSYDDMPVSDTPKGFESVTDMSKQAKRLERQLRCTQILQWINLFFLLLLAAAVVYLLKLQILGGGIETTTTKSVCIKGKHI